MVFVSLEITALRTGLFCRGAFSFGERVGVPPLAGGGDRGSEFE